MVKINIIILIIRRLLDRKRSGNTIIILTKRKNGKNKIVKIKGYNYYYQPNGKDVPRKISRNKSVQNTIISIPKVKLTFIKAL